MNIRDKYKLDIEKINSELEHATVFNILEWCYKIFPHDKIKLSTSFGAEGIVLLHILKTVTPNPRVFTIDTGRNFNEMYELWEEVNRKYNIKIETFFPR